MTTLCYYSPAFNDPIYLKENSRTPLGKTTKPSIIQYTNFELCCIRSNSSIRSLSNGRGKTHWKICPVFQLLLAIFSDSHKIIIIVLTDNVRLKFPLQLRNLAPVNGMAPEAAPARPRNLATFRHNIKSEDKRAFTSDREHFLLNRSPSAPHSCIPNTKYLVNYSDIERSV